METTSEKMLCIYIWIKFMQKKTEIPRLNLVCGHHELQNN